MPVIENKLEFYEVPQRGDPYVKKFGSRAGLTIRDQVVIGSSTKIEMKFQFLDARSAFSAYLFRYNNGPAFGISYSFGDDNPTWAMIANNYSYYAGANTADLDEHVLTYYDNKYYIDDVLVRECPEIITTPEDGFLFYTEAPWKAKIYYFKIYNGNSLVLSYVPAFYNGSYTFYDEISQTYAGRSGTAANYDGFIPGPPTKLFDIGNSQIDSIHSVEALSFLGDELSYDTLEANVHRDKILSFEDSEVVVSYSEEPHVMPYGTPMLHYMDDVLESRYFIEEMKRIGLTSFGIDSISGIGLLSRQYHAGGLFSGESFLLVVAEVLGDSIDYSVSPELASVPIYGHLPYATRRDNLRQLLFATNGHVFRDANKQIYFDFLDNSEAVEVLDASIFENGSVEYPKLATKVTLTEHNYYYYSGVQAVTLFDNTNGYEVTNLLVKFQNAPIYPASLASTGTLTFKKASVNCAVVSGQGTLTGKPYVHTTLDLTRYDDESGREDYEVSVTDATLVSAANGENVADRVADYWFHRHIIKADIKWSGEKCGKLYSMTNAFLENEEGFLVRMEKVVSTFVRASCEFIAGVGSGGGGNAFENYALITSSGSWTIPEGVETIRLILVGGGSGGQSGLKGADGRNSSGGAGGPGGSSGNGGRIYVLTLQNVSGTLSISIGTGGAGGAACSNEKTPNEGVEGNPTTVTIGGMTYTSSAGARSPSGVENIFTGIIYALPGAPGTAGAPGGSGQQGQSEAGSGAADKPGGAPGASAYGMNAQTSGGAGSGASATTNGSAGGNASVVHVESSTSSEWFDYYSHTPGAGANGVAATQRAAATTPGAGGDGGHGGSGAGGCGVFNGSITDQWEGDFHIKIGDERSSTAVSAGVGGYGGAGGNGAAGCVIIYY